MMGDVGVVDASAHCSRMFELCLNVIEAEKAYNEELSSKVSHNIAKSLQVLVAAISEVCLALSDADKFTLYQVR